MAPRARQVQTETALDPPTRAGTAKAAEIAVYPAGAIQKMCAATAEAAARDPDAAAAVAGTQETISAAPEVLEWGKTQERVVWAAVGKVEVLTETPEVMETTEWTDPKGWLSGKSARIGRTRTPTKAAVTAQTVLLALVAVAAAAVAEMISPAAEPVAEEAQAELLGGSELEATVEGARSGSGL